MATRSLTEVFVLMRNNAIRSRHIYNDQDASERMQLVSLNDMEEGATGDYLDNSAPPVWINQLEECQFTISKLKPKIQELKALHSRHMQRPTFDDNTDDETQIENCSSEIQAMFNLIYRNVNYIKGHSSEGGMRQRQLTQSVVRALANVLQELSTQFRSTQNNYLRQIQSREERSRVFFDNPALEDDLMLAQGEENIDEYFLNSRQSQQLLQLEEENTRMVHQREQKVNAIVKSILDLNSIFKDLSQMVSDQGTVLDRIDYNIEQTQTQVYEGFKQLQKADAYQRKNRKMCAIIVLASSVIVLVFILIVIKS